jgi:hypothetical protein
LNLLNCTYCIMLSHVPHALIFGSWSMQLQVHVQTARNTGRPAKELGQLKTKMCTQWSYKEPE